MFSIGLAKFQVIREWECLDSDTGEDLAKELRKFHIPDFSSWKTNHDVYKEQFEKLLRDLKAQERSLGETV